jgi:hypothetical protein
MTYVENRKRGTEAYNSALEMTDKALDAYVEGDEKAGGKLVD